jgi:hypothetical protein
MSDQQKPIALGMVGGGPDSGIGSTHRIAIRIDNKCELVAGAFSRNRAKFTLMARELGFRTTGRTTITSLWQASNQNAKIKSMPSVS